jgi:hypothetical protein
LTKSLRLFALEKGEVMQASRRTALALGVACVLVVTLVSLASAAKPTRQPIPASEDIVIGDCAFPVEIDFLREKGTLTTLFFGFSPTEGFPTFFLTEGKFVFEDGTFTQVGRLVDLCAELAT